MVETPDIYVFHGQTFAGVSTINGFDNGISPLDFHIASCVRILASERTTLSCTLMLWRVAKALFIHSRHFLSAGNGCLFAYVRN